MLSEASYERSEFKPAGGPGVGPLRIFWNLEPLRVNLSVIWQIISYQQQIIDNWPKIIDKAIFKKSSLIFPWYFPDICEIKKFPDISLTLFIFPIFPVRYEPWLYN